MKTDWKAGPDRPAIPAIGVDVWHANLDAEPWPPLAQLPPSERGRAERIRAPLLRERWVAARWALRRVLALYLEQSPGQIELRISSRGKPGLAGPSPPLRFNLSHSGGAALIGVCGEREVGVDIERADRQRDFVRLAEIGLDEEGAAAVRTAPPQARAAVFYAAWVRREAIVKCFGAGLGVPVPRTPVAVACLDVVDGCATAVAVAGSEMPQTQCFSFG